MIRFDSFPERAKNQLVNTLEEIGPASKPLTPLLIARTSRMMQNAQSNTLHGQQQQPEP